MSPELSAWRDKGGYLKTALFAHKVFYQDFGNAQAAADKTLLLLHGFPESSYSYHKVVDGLLEQFERVVLFDFPGYGLSDKPTENYTYSLFEQADVALQIWRQLDVRGGHLLAHDMGDSVATELVARDVSCLLPAWFEQGFLSLTFTNGSMLLNLARLRVMQKALLTRFGPLLGRLSNRRTFFQQLRSAHGTDRLSEQDLALLWENVCLQDGQRKNHLIIKYLHDRRRFEASRWLPALAASDKPIHLCWGEADAVASVQMAHHLKAKVCPAAAVTLMPEVGHFCQLSDPDVWLSSVSNFYQGL